MSSSSSSPTVFAVGDRVMTNDFGAGTVTELQAAAGNISLNLDDNNIGHMTISSLPRLVWHLSQNHEEEDAIFSERSKMYIFCKEDKDGDRVRTNWWKETGKGQLEILKHKTTGKYRILMRQEQDATNKIICNVPIGGDESLTYPSAKQVTMTVQDYDTETALFVQKTVAFKVRGPPEMEAFKTAYAGASFYDESKWSCQSCASYDRLGVSQTKKIVNLNHKIDRLQSNILENAQQVRDLRNQIQRQSDPSIPPAQANIQRSLLLRDTIAHRDQLAFSLSQTQVGAPLFMNQLLNHERNLLNPSSFSDAQLLSLQEKFTSGAAAVAREITLRSVQASSHQTQCSVCWELPSTFVFPCGHQCVCVNCALQPEFQQNNLGCPICRQQGIPVQLHLA